MIQRRYLVVAAAAVLGFGVWLGHATTTTPAAAAASEPARAVKPQLAMRAPTLVHPTAPGLAQDLRDPDPKVRRAAVRELAHSDASDPVMLLAASRDGDLGVAVTATEGLDQLYRDGRISAKDLAERITDHQLAEKVRVTAMNGLGVIPSSEGAQLFQDLIVHGDTTDRRTAAILLQHQDPPAAVPSLIAALADRDEVVRSNAIESLRSFARGRDFGQDAAAWQRWWQSRAN